MVAESYGSKANYVYHTGLRFGMYYDCVTLQISVPALQQQFLSLRDTTWLNSLAKETDTHILIGPNVIALIGRQANGVIVIGSFDSAEKAGAAIQRRVASLKVSTVTVPKKRCVQAEFTY